LRSRIHQSNINSEKDFDSIPPVVKDRNYSIQNPTPLIVLFMFKLKEKLHIIMIVMIVVTAMLKVVVEVLGLILEFKKL